MIKKAQAERAEEQALSELDDDDFQEVGSWNGSFDAG